MTPDSAGEDGAFTATVTLANRGTRLASETVFLFTHDKVAVVSRPLLELRGFDHLTLKPGESGTVTLSLPARDLRFPGLDMEPLFEPGEIEILVGPSADRTRLLSATVRLV